MCQRKVELTSNPMFHPWYQRLFGTPFILRIPDLDGFTGRELYDLVAKRVKRYVPLGVLHFLAKQEELEQSIPTETDSSGNRRILRRGRRQKFNQTSPDAEESAFGSIPRYGFRLRVTSRDGKRCELCPWYEACVGCLITDDDYPTIAMCGDTVAIDWHLGIDVATDCFDALSSGAEPRANMLTNVKKHKTCHAGKIKSGKGHITLDDCLHAFSKEEDMDDVSIWSPAKYIIMYLLANLDSKHYSTPLPATDILFKLQGTPNTDEVNESLEITPCDDYYTQTFSIHRKNEKEIEKLYPFPNRRA